MSAPARHRWRWRWLPLISWSPWGGDMDDSKSSVEGWSISLAWLGLYVEIIGAREGD